MVEGSKTVNHTCRTCVFWQAPVINGPVAIKEMPPGECHYGPPTVSFIPIPTPNGQFPVTNFSGWPPKTATDWCGRHQNFLGIFEDAHLRQVGENTKLSIGDCVFADRDTSIALVIVKIEISSVATSYYCCWWDSGKHYGEWFDEWRLVQITGVWPAQELPNALRP